MNFYIPNSTNSYIRWTKSDFTRCHWGTGRILHFRITILSNARYVLERTTYASSFNSEWFFLKFTIGFTPPNYRKSPLFNEEVKL